MPIFKYSHAFTLQQLDIILSQYLQLYPYYLCLKNSLEEYMENIYNKQTLRQRHFIVNISNNSNFMFNNITTTVNLPMNIPGNLGHTANNNVIQAMRCTQNSQQSNNSEQNNNNLLKNNMQTSNNNNTYNYVSNQKQHIILIPINIYNQKQVQQGLQQIDKLNYPNQNPLKNILQPSQLSQTQKHQFDIVALYPLSILIQILNSNKFYLNLPKNIIVNGLLSTTNIKIIIQTLILVSEEMSKLIESKLQEVQENKIQKLFYQLMGKKYGKDQQQQDGELNNNGNTQTNQINKNKQNRRISHFQNVITTESTNKQQQSKSFQESFQGKSFQSNNRPKKISQKQYTLILQILKRQVKLQQREKQIQMQNKQNQRIQLQRLEKQKSQFYSYTSINKNNQKQQNDMLILKKKQENYDKKNNKSLKRASIIASILNIVDEDKSQNGNNLKQTTSLLQISNSIQNIACTKQQENGNNNKNNKKIIKSVNFNANTSYNQKNNQFLFPKHSPPVFTTCQYCQNYRTYILQSTSLSYFQLKQINKISLDTIKQLFIIINYNLQIKLIEY